MPATITDQLLALQTSVKARLDNDAFFSDITVMLARAGVTEKDVDAATGPNKAKNGKTGACCIVTMPIYLAREGESPGPVLLTGISVQVIEARINNALASVGTGKSAELIADNVLNLLDLCRFYDMQTLMAAKRPLVPFETKRVDWTSYLVNFEIMRGLARTDRVANPEMSSAGGLITITCATAGASIYYTLNDTFPGSANSNAVLYSGPFNPGAATLARAVAYKSSYIPSDEIAYHVS